MRLKTIINLSILLLFVSFSTQISWAKGTDGNKNSLNKTLGLPTITKFNINNISTFIYANGWSDVTGSNPGYTYPTLSGKTANFQSGFLFGGYIGNPADNVLRIGGSVYRTSLTAGRILSPGVADDPNNANVRIYRVRRDYKIGSVATEMLDEGKSETDVRAQYEKDWNEWPAQWGAPYQDVNGNGVYEPTIDIPGVPGADQTIWFVANDLNATQAATFYQTTPMGVEEQCTVWGYKAAGALGNMLFKKYVLINKNAQSKDFNQFYVSYWDDIDIGGGAYDLAGCDTTLDATGKPRSLFFTYSGIPNNSQYGLTPPATGLDFFQGPKVRGLATDTAIYNGKYWPGYKNLPMSASYFFINPDAIYADPNQNAAIGITQWYRLFQGQVSTTGIPMQDPFTLKNTKFGFAGNVFTKTGWLDGVQFAPGDRRDGGVCGPFTLAYGDTQEVVIAEMSAGATAGIDNIAALRLLFNYDDVAQIAYNRLFKLPAPAPQPTLAITPLDKQLVLDWGSNAAAVTATESFDNLGYKFQGYNLYQLPSNSASISDGILLKTFDIVDGITVILDKKADPSSGALVDYVAANGSDYLKRSYLVTEDKLAGAPELHNGSKYYFALSSYSYNPNPPFGDKVLNNPLAIITAIPHAPDPGVGYNGKADAALSILRTGGLSDGTVTGKVIDPSKSTGDNYRVSFETDANDNIVWKLTDVTKNVVRLSGQDQNIGDASTIIDGIQIQANGPALGINSYAFTPSADRWLDYYSGPDLGINFLGSSVTPDQYVKIEVRFLSTPTGQNAYRYLRGGTPNYGYQDYIPQYFTCWDVTHSPARQLSVAYVTQKGQPTEHLPWQPTTDPGTSREYFFPLPNAYTATPDPVLMAGIPNSGVYPAMFALWPQLRAGKTFNPQAGQIFTITPFFVNTTADVFTFTTPSVSSYDANKAIEDVKNINVFPNPYYGVNPQELTKYNRWVTFSHLPASATIRIFNLAGQLVRTITHNDGTQFQRWDLQNENNLPVGSGLYIVHIDMPDLGTTKILKVAIIQEKQILDIF
ncbi:MAG: T9SS type A sorting domain-containing protein [Ignavibacteriales bacterium]|nr:T9SS type A sorting domain-containing protein [Ignavibacteriales bacterium]